MNLNIIFGLWPRRCFWLSSIWWSIPTLIVLAAVNKFSLHVVIVYLKAWPTVNGKSHDTRQTHNGISNYSRDSNNDHERWNFREGKRRQNNGGPPQGVFVSPFCQPFWIVSPVGHNNAQRRPIICCFVSLWGFLKKIISESPGKGRPGIGVQRFSNSSCVLKPAFIHSTGFTVMCQTCHMSSTPS